MLASLTETNTIARDHPNVSQHAGTATAHIGRDNWSLLTATVANRDDPWHNLGVVKYDFVLDMVHTVITDSRDHFYSDIEPEQVVGVHFGAKRIRVVDANPSGFERAGDVGDGTQADFCLFNMFDTIDMQQNLGRVYGTRPRLIKIDHILEGLQLESDTAGTSILVGHANVKQEELFIAGRPVHERTQRIITERGLTRLVSRMAEIVDSKIPAGTYRAGRIVYQEAIEDPADWEILILSVVDLSKEERFDVSLDVGEMLGRVIEGDPDSGWIHVSYGFDITS